MTDDPTLTSSQSVDGKDPSPGSIDKLQPDDDMIQDPQRHQEHETATSVEKDPTESEDQDGSHDPIVLGGQNSDINDQQQEMPVVQSSATIESDKDIKAREKSLRVAEAVAPPPPSMSSLLSSNNRESKEHEKASSIRTASSGVRSSTSSDANSKRAAAAGGSSSAGSQPDRNPLRYSTDHHVAKHAKARGQQQQPTAGPGAVRVGDVEEANKKTPYFEAVPLTAEAVDDAPDEENIRQLRQSNEALRKQVEQALENERKALEEMQTMAQAPPANVAVVMGDAATATSVIVSEEPPESRPSTTAATTTTEQTTKCCWNLAKGTVFFAGCCCIFCVVIIVVVFFAVGVDNIIATAGNDAEDVVQGATRRSNLRALLQDLEPLHEEAFDWLANIDQWDPELRNATAAPNDQAVTIDDIGDFVDRITNADGGASVGTGPRRWMFVERYYLAVLYFSTNGDNWEQNFGWMSETSSHCSEGAKKWFGIQCENDSIVSIELETNNLDGNFPKEIRVLRDLRSIWMSGDGFDSELAGTIPTMPGNLTQIWLWNMKLNGSLPEQLFELSGLTSLRLYENQFTGAVPSNIIQLTDLQTLELVGNQLTGTIPVLPNVTSCDLSSNKFANTTNGAEQGCVVFDQNP
ncbi:MAG: hypothetical protein SGBAC_008878 [Bacillariaceae sp.]